MCRVFPRGKHLSSSLLFDESKENVPSVVSLPSLTLSVFIWKRNNVVLEGLLGYFPVLVLKVLWLHLNGFNASLKVRSQGSLLPHWISNFIYPPLCLSTYPSMHPLVHLSIHPHHPSLSISPYMYPSTHLKPTCSSILICIYTYVRPSIYPYIHFFIYPLTCLFISSSYIRPL